MHLSSLLQFAVTGILARAAVAALGAALLLAGCSAREGASGPYKIGVVLSITGPNAPLGTVERDTINLLVDQINESGGINGHPLEAIIIDDGSDETRAVTAATKLIHEDRVLGLLGSVGSGPALAMAAVAEKNEVPQVALASSVKLVQPVRKWVFKSIYSDIWDVQAILEFL